MQSSYLLFNLVSFKTFILIFLHTGLSAEKYREISSGASLLEK